MSEVKTFTVKAAEITKRDVGKYGNNEITATLENGDGKSAEVTFLQKPDSPLPEVGSTLTGTVTKDQYGLKFKREWKQNGGGGYSKDREESINRAVAIKSATELVSARIVAGELKGQEAAQAALEAMTIDIIALVTGDKEKKAEGKAAEAKTDDDIPF